MPDTPTFADLKGRRIVDAYETDDKPPIAVLLLDGDGPPLALAAWRDPEQNGPGALFAIDTASGEHHYLGGGW